MLFPVCVVLITPDAEAAEKFAERELTPELKGRTIIIAATQEAAIDRMRERFAVTHPTATLAGKPDFEPYRRDVTNGDRIRQFWGSKP